jgi:hypothetical protein
MDVTEPRQRRQYAEDGRLRARALSIRAGDGGGVQRACGHRQRGENGGGAVNLAGRESGLLDFACFDQQSRVDLRARFNGCLRVGNPGAGLLIIRTKPANEAAFFLFRALSVERDKPPQSIFVGQIGRPAISLRHKGIYFVVQFIQDKHKALGLDRLFGIAQRLLGAQLFPPL